jgi:hypothetical protein
MPNLKLQVSRALNVIPSNNTNIPMPNEVVSFSSITGALTTNKLIDSTKNFSSVGVKPLNIQVGDIVYNFSSSPQSAAKVVKVDSATQLTLNADIFTVVGSAYTLYSGTNIAGSIEPCVLYIGTGGDLDIITAGGDYAYLANVPSGTFLPIQVIKVNQFGTASNIVALW